MVAVGLGTAQFGKPYGIANREGQVGVDEVRRILAAALEAKVSVVDTAPAYGCAEDVLGASLPADHPFRIVTKTPVDGMGVRRSLQRSLERLRQPRVAGLLVHRSADLLGPGGDALFADLVALRAEGLVERVGVSVYHPEEAAALLDQYPLELVQLPFSVLDQRARTSGLLDRLRGRGVEVHVRSVFLQGLLLMDPAVVPAALAGVRPVLETFRRRASRIGSTLVEAAVGFVAAVPGVDAIVGGVDRIEHLQELTAAAAHRVDPEVFADLGSEDLGWIDPSRWSAQG